MKDRKMMAKFRLDEMTHRHTYSQDEVAVDLLFRAVYGSEGDNGDFCKATPSGEIKMMVTNPAALENIELGADYYLTFEKAE